jgi:hypothetical protein
VKTSIILLPCLKLLQPHIQQWVKPLPSSFIPGTLADLARSSSELIFDNAFLHQQVLVLSRQRKRARLTHQERRLFVFLAQWLPSLEIGIADQSIRDPAALASGAF